MRPRRAGGGLAAVRYSLARAREAGGLVPLTRRLRSAQRLQDLRGRHGRHGNERGSFPEVCKKSIQAQAADMQPPIGEAFFRGARSRRPRAPGVARAGGGRPDRLPAPLPRRRSPLSSHRLGRGAGCRRRRAPGRAARSDVLLRLGAEQQRGGVPAAVLRARVRHQQRQQLLVLLSPGVERGARRRRSAAARPPSRSTISRRPTWRWCRRQPGVEPSAPDHAARRAPAARRHGDRDQSAARGRAGALPRAVGLAQHAASAPTSRDLYLQPHVGSDIALLTLLLQGVIERGARRRGLRARAHDRLGRGARARRRSSPRETLLAACGVPAAQVDAAVDSPLRGAARASSRGRWGSRSTRTASTTCTRSPISRWRAAGSVAPAPGCCRSAVTRTCRASARSASTPALKAEFARRLGRALRRDAAGARRACTRSPASRRRPRDASTRRCCSAATCSRRRPIGRFAGRRRCAHRHDGVRLDQAEREPRPRPRPDRARAAGAGARRGAAVHDAGEHVQLRPRLRRRRRPRRPPRCARRSRSSPGSRRACCPPGPVDFGALTDHAAIREAIARVVPGYEAIAGIERTRREFHVAGRTFHEPRFGTDGRPRPLPARRRSRPSRRDPASSA